MKFCSLHKEEVDEEKMIKIIEIKNGKIQQTSVCQDCMKKHLEKENIELIENIPENVNEIIEFFMEKKEEVKKDKCLNCKKNDSEEPLEQKNKSIKEKIKELEKKMADAVVIEDYETAAIIKKQIDKIKN